VDNISQILIEFDPVSLEELDKVRLMNRVDCKFIFNINKLPTILNNVKDKYNILEINNGVLLIQYSNGIKRLLKGDAIFKVILIFGFILLL